MDGIKMSTKKLSRVSAALAVLLLVVMMGAFGLLVGRAQAPKPKPTLVPTAVLPDATPTATQEPAPDTASVNGRVWHDLCAIAGGEGSLAVTPSDGCVPSSDGGYQANGQLEDGEPGLGGVLVQIGVGACPAFGLASATTGLDGGYSFAGLDAGTYCVTVDASRAENGLLLPGGWTFPAVNASNGVAGHTVTLTEGERRTEVNFGWDYQFLPLPEPVPTTPTPTQPVATDLPQPTSTSRPAPTQTPLPPLACTDKATFIQDVTIPDNTRLLPGQSFVKTWRLRNAGTCTWTTDYAVVFASGHSLGGPLAIPLQRSVAPGSTTDLSVTLTAPAEFGAYESRWQLRNADVELFGIGRNADAPFWVKIVVGPATTPTPAPPRFTYWRGEYYTNRDLAGNPVLVRDDTEIAFNWGTAAPASGMPSDSFSARWSRSLPFQGGTYRFYAYSDDGVRVWLDGELIIDQWRDAANIAHAAERTLTAATHTLRVEYYENGGAARIQFWWERLSDFPQWRGEYYPNVTLSGNALLVRNDTDLNFNWGRGAPVTGLPADGFSVRWTRTLAFDAGLYRFRVSMDDGARLWVDDALVVNAWSDGGRREVTGDYRLSAGHHTLRVEYYERAGDASIRLWWEKIDVYPDWRGEYWSNPYLSGNPTLVRNDVTLDFNWRQNAPAAGLPSNDFSARWTRKVNFDADTYRFHVLVDDGARLWVDDRLYIDSWRDGVARELTADVPLARGQHSLRLEFYERGDNARIRLWWDKVGSVSYPDWKGEYWANRNLSGSPALLRNDTAIDFRWNKGAAAAGLPADEFSARWSRQVTFEPGIYLFSAQADDGIRFSLDGQLLLNEWHSSDGKEVYSVDKVLTGPHQLVVEYYEDRGGALAKFWWKRVGAVPTPSPTPAPNRPPVAVDDSVITAEDVAVSVNVLANDSDPNGDALSISSYQTDSARGGTVSCTSAGMCTFTPAANYSGDDSFGYTASDGRGGSSGAVVRVTVSPVNDPPRAVDDSVTTAEDVAVNVNVLVNDSDPDGDALSISSHQVNSARGGTVSCTNVGMCTYTPAANYSGDDNFSYTVSDGKGGTSSAVVRVTVSPVNDPPVAADDLATTDQDTPVTINVLANDSDPDGDPLTVSNHQVTSSRGGTVSCDGAGRCTYSPAAGFNGSDSFTYTVSDGKGGSDSATVSLTVNPLPDPVNVRLNEILSVPGSTEDWDGDGKADEQDEWIELYNAGTDTVELGGWAIGNGVDTYLLPAETVLRPGALVVFFQKQTGIPLGDSGGVVQLIGATAEVVDSVTYGALGPDASYSRDETGAWHSDWPPSPGRVNAPSGPTMVPEPGAVAAR
jgi:hypothetical protein